MTIAFKLNHAEIARLSSPGGPVWEWTKDKGRETRKVAVATCPKRSTHLANSHRLNVSKLPQGCYAKITNTASYAEAVHEGTMDAEIIPDTWPYMVLQPAWNGHPVNKQVRVSGQDANPWLEQAMNHVMGSAGRRG